MVDTISNLALAGGLSWASGLRLYLALFIAGWFSQQGWIDLPLALEVLESPWVLVVTGSLAMIEFLADKVPLVDSSWDVLQTFIRIPAGAILAAAAMGTMDPAWTTVAVLLGGGIAAGTHFTKASTRAVINLSPEPFSNWTASATEDVMVTAGLLSAFFFPWLLFLLLVLFMVLALWLLPRVGRGLNRFFRKRTR